MEGGGKTRGVTFDATNEMQSPRFRAIMRATSTRKRRPRVEVKSFSHELGLKGSQHYQIRNQRSEDTAAIMKIKFERLKEDVNSELGIFAADLVGLLEKAADDHPPGWKEAIEDLLVVARECTKMSPEEFWLKCEGIVQVLDDRRQELPMSTLKKAHTRMLFILTRCTRLLQFQKEGGLPEADHVLGLHQLSDLGVYPSRGGALSVISHNVKNLISTRNMMMKERLSVDGSPHSISPSSRNRISSWKKLPSAAEMKVNLKNIKDHVADALDPCPPKGPGGPSPAPLPAGEGKGKAAPGLPAAPPKKLEDPPPASPPVVQEQYQQSQLDGNLAMICRICDLKIPRVHVEDHSRICAIAARCDAKGLNVNERLDRVADVLERMLETCSPKSAGNSAPAAVAEVAVRALYSSTMAERERAGDLSHAKENHPRSSDDAGAADDHSPPGIILSRPCTVSGVNVVPTILCKPPPPAAAAASGPASATSSPGSLTPSSSSSTPRHPDMDLLFTGRSKFSDLENFQQIHDLLDIARCVANTNKNGYDSLEFLHASLEDLQEVIQAKKVDALLVETFGRRIEKLLREKYAYILQQIDDGATDLTSVAMEDEDGSSSSEIQASQSQCPRAMCSKIKDRTTIEDFEIIKPISRGAFGRVFLARKRVTGDLFAIKVLKKADMIRKNAVESILAERNILISVRNPFVVRFFYSFTCRENLYLVMEYLNGGDLYSLLRNLGCLDEDMTRMYIAEVILALEYLHSLNVVHRDLKPDNLLIAHDGHIKLTDFGLSIVGLINSTDDLSGPDLSSSTLLGDPDQEAPPAERTLKREQRQKQSVVGTPDYLAPEILLGMAHGPTADWWSVGIILYELLVGIPPFNAEHPQKIFDNIMNRSITWPSVPAEMTHEAHDLIDKLLTENPVQRLGATGAGEVKSHPFFRSINWDMLAKQKAAFVPSLEGDDDTSYFTCRHTWSSLSGQIRSSLNDYDDTSDTCTMSCSSSPYSYDPDEEGDECGSLANFSSSNLNVQYSFSNFSFKNLSQLASMNYDLLMKEDYTSANISTTMKS